MLISERKIDALGRIVLPSDMRKRLGLAPGDSLCVVFQNGQILLKKA